MISYNFLSKCAYYHSGTMLIAVILGVMMLVLLNLRKKNQPVDVSKKQIVLTSQDIKAIAGDNVMATQLDLARAYIEIGKTSLAKKILDHVVDHGDVQQQQAAKELIKTINS